MQVHVVKVEWATHQQQLQHVRTVVFVDEQKVPAELEWEPADQDATHFLALNEAGQALGCARLLANGQIGRMAVLAEYRNTGLGARLLEAAVAEGRRLGLDRVFLHAQSYVQGFYNKLGFVVCGPEFSEVNIPHIPMEMKLPLDFVPVQTPAVHAAQRPTPSAPADLPATQSQHPSAEPPPPIPFASLDGAIANLARLSGQAQRQFFLMSPYLPQELFEAEPVIDGLSQFVRSAARVELKILIMSNKLIVTRGHRLLDLARRLDDKIEIRRYDEEIEPTTSAFACADLNAYWLQPAHEQHEGILSLDDPVICQRMRETFRQAWEKSRPDPDLRVLRL